VPDLGGLAARAPGLRPDGLEAGSRREDEERDQRAGDKATTALPVKVRTRGSDHAAMLALLRCAWAPPDRPGPARDLRLSDPA
jgi:hypothetical protein